ncbi:hypothetical protein I4U23_019643 [Adineta vaga]|nr:hypothetical protein I4U23_019643 [Adineta vaga]
MAMLIGFYILMGFILSTHGNTTPSTLPSTFMNYAVEYEDIDPYSCSPTTTVIVPGDTTTICLTTTQEATTADLTTETTTSTSTTSSSTSTTSTSTSTTSSSTSATSTSTTTSMVSSGGSSFIAPICANQTLGLSCNISSDPCTMLQPCLNSATCYQNISVTLGYVCKCQTDFSGVNCEIDNGTCGSNSICLNGGSCNSTVNETTCKCPQGKTGTHCEYEIDVCTNVSCQNSGQCISKYGNWSCLCTNSHLYSGTYCEHKSSGLRTKEIVSRSFACVAIGCLATVVSFIIIMDILKYGFKINPVGSETETWRAKKEHQYREARRRRRGLKKKEFNNPKSPVVALRFNYINA